MCVCVQIENIIAQRIYDGPDTKDTPLRNADGTPCKEYRVKWKGFTCNHNRWVHEHGVCAPQLIARLSENKHSERVPRKRKLIPATITDSPAVSPAKKVELYALYCRRFDSQDHQRFAVAMDVEKADLQYQKDEQRRIEKSDYRLHEK